jgi:protein-tyrosine phosphatase
MKAFLDKLKSWRGGPEDAPSVGSSVQPSFAILFVCMGNICRSPTAEGVFRRIVAAESLDFALDIDSAGTHAYHIGDAPDPRARRAAATRGVDLSEKRARRVSVEDFARFDLVLAMDELNHATLLELCPLEHRDRVRFFLEFAPQVGRLDVPDPYYGGTNGFEYVLDLVEEGSRGLLEHVRQVLEARPR